MARLLKISELKPTEANTDRALKTLDDLRHSIEKGESIAFLAVSIAPDDELFAWIGQALPISKLRMYGAVARLCQDYEVLNWVEE